MAKASTTPTSIDGVTALYRRFRPGRFVELRGQDPVVRALQGAVKNERVSHAYLFSGPRGTGKTTTARILAKALNCENPLDGDACNKCASCVAITKGTSLDVTELDAASNNGVDDIRDITAGAWHGTPGTWKVYIFDEVHQLSKAASAALLKTLEEPPPHVVFVLATTDPHKVMPTIRSRTQHLEFRLFNGETLSSLLHEVEHAAGLSADDATIEAAVRLGRGSARDALSALDQLLATGSIVESQPEFDGLFRALVDADAVAALKSLAELTREGWDPEQLAESFAGDVRQVFLLQVAPEVADAVDSDRDRLTAWGNQLGLPRTVRVLETVGRAMREMKSAPEKIVILEVAMVRLVKPELDSTVEALDERVTKLERDGVRVEPTTPAPPAVLRPIGTAAPVSPTLPVKEPAPPPMAESVEPETPSRNGETTFDLDDVRARFVENVVPRTSRGAQLLLKSAFVRSIDGQHLTIALPSEEMRQNTELIAQGLRSAMEHEFKSPLQITWAVDPTLAHATPAPTSTSRPTRSREPDVEETYSPDETVIVVDSAGDHLITEMFPRSDGDHVTYPPPLQAVVDELGRFPGVGPKSAQRIAFWLMRQPSEDVARLAVSIEEMKTKLSFCERCCNIAEAGGLCPICADERRDQTTICVVENPPDVVAVERSGAFHGTYHVLHGVLNPLEGVTPDRLRIQELILRLRGPVKEVILCFNSNVEGDATAMYLSRLLQVPGLIVSQPASGLPVGGDLEFADDLTLGRAIDGRRVLTD